MSRNGRHLFTSESVTEGHPDKIADQISDSILDAILAQDPVSRVACETLVTTGLAVVAGEITTSAYVDFQEVVRATINEIGYNRGKYGFDGETCAVLSSIHSQSPDIAMGVDIGGAGDQGLMFGFACTETEELMPLPIMLAHKLAKGLSCARRDGVLEYLRPDGKSQVTIEYDGNEPVRVAAGVAERALVQLAYAIGVADPVSVAVHTEGTGRIPEEKITQIVRDHFKLTPRGIMEELDLRRPIYKKTAAFGHFGRNEPEFTWERTDKAAALRTAAGL